MAHGERRGAIELVATSAGISRNDAYSSGIDGQKMALFNQHECATIQLKFRNYVSLFARASEGKRKIIIFISGQLKINTQTKRQSGGKDSKEMMNAHLLAFTQHANERTRRGDWILCARAPPTERW